MVTAIILIKTSKTAVNDTAKQLLSIAGITEVYSVSGKHDLLAIARVSSNDEVSDLVTERLLEIERIIETETMLAFKAFSEFDLEAMFSVGM